MKEFEGFHKRLAYLIEQKNLKQIDLCKLTNISKNAISNYMNGKRIPDTYSAYKLSQSLHVSMEWLLTGVEPAHHEQALQPLLTDMSDSWEDVFEVDEQVQKMLSANKSIEQIITEFEDYNVKISMQMIDRITDKLLPEISAWQERPLDAIYPLVFVDTIHYKLLVDGRYLPRMVHVITGYTLSGLREFIGLYLCEEADDHCWEAILKDMKDRSVEKLLIVSADYNRELAGVLPRYFDTAHIHKNVIRQVLGMLGHISYEDRAPFSLDFQSLLLAPTLEDANRKLEEIRGKWDKYGLYIQIWVDEWESFAAFYQYPDSVKELLINYHIKTGASRELFKAISKLSKANPYYSSNKLALKNAYLVVSELAARWSIKPQNWNRALQDLNQVFPGTLRKYIFD